MDDCLKYAIIDGLDLLNLPRASIGKTYDANNVMTLYLASIPNELSIDILKNRETVFPIIEEWVKKRNNGELSIDPNMFFDDNKFIPKIMGDHIISRVFIKTLNGSDEVYYYSDGLYVPNGRELVRNICTKYLGIEYRQSYVNETLDYIRNMTYTGPNNINNVWINLENGLLNPLTMEFKEHTPEVFSITRVPIKYDANAKCPLWIATLNEKVDKNTAHTVQEMFGYCFLAGQLYERAFLLYGPKRSFKSTTLYILGELIGEDNVTAYPLQQLTDDLFSAAYLYGKSANICADLTSHSLRDTGRFLIITGGDKLTAGKKNQHHITFYPNTKLIFSCNVIPATTNKNPAFYRRWIILTFNKQTPIEKVEPNMKKKLGIELPGILNWALEGLKRLLEQKKFSYELTEDEVKDLYERSSDTIQSFIFNNIDIENDEGSLTKREVFKIYLEYCHNNELQPENSIKFGRMFIALTGCGTGRKGSEGQQIPCYQGVNWKKLNEKKEEIQVNLIMK